MHFRISWRAVVIALPAGLVVTVAVAACRDALLPDKQPANDAGVTRMADRGAVSSVSTPARARLSAHNPHDFVGIAHNAGLSDFRGRLHATGKAPRNMCKFIEAFLLEAERVPADRRTVSAAKRGEIVRTTLAGTSLCARKHGSTTRTVLMPPVPTPQASTEAHVLVDGIDAALDAASSADDLANRLWPVLEAAAGLAPVERIAVEATIGVAQASYDYWTTNYGSLEQEVATLYGECVSQNADASSDEAIDRCMNGAGGWESRSYRHRPGISARFASLGGGDCDIVSASAGQRRIWRADARGAFGGALVGAFGGFEAAIVGGLLGGMANSVTEGLGLVAMALWCHYQ